MSLSKAKIRERVATDLGVRALGDGLQSHDSARIDQGYKEVYNQLKHNGLAAWAYNDEVPDKFVPYVVALICANCAITFGLSQERMTLIMNAANRATRNIRELINSEYISHEPITDF